jgi:hypothetical protein
MAIVISRLGGLTSSVEMTDHITPGARPEEPRLTLEISVSKAFLSQALGISFDRGYYFDPFVRRQADVRCHEYVEQQLQDLDAFYTESNLGRKAFFEPNQVLVGGIQPNLILGMLLGAEFVPAKQGDADISPACWAGKSPEELPPVKALLEHPLIRLFEKQIKSLQEQSTLKAIPPFFWDASGRAAVHGALTTAQKFLGEEVFLDLLTEPDRVMRAMSWITDANIVLVRHFGSLCGIQIQCLHVGECSSCMIGPAEWKSFVAPTLERFGREVGPVRLHSCGPSNHLLAPAREIPALCSLDLGGETSLAQVRELFGRDFPVSMAPPVKLLADGSQEALMNWTRDVLIANQGGKLTFLCHLEPQYSLAILRAWCDSLNALEARGGMATSDGPADSFTPLRPH